MIKHELPPNWDEIIKHFPADFDKGVIVTYGEDIYYKYELNAWKLAHEKTHIKQQTEMGVEKWWARYFEDVEFRLSQEIEAYRNEINWIKQNIKDRNKKFLMIRSIWQDLSSPLYGGICSMEQAKQYLPLS